MIRRWVFFGGIAIALGVLFFAARPATAVVVDGFFVDDNTSQFEADIDAIANARITLGCNAAGTRYCPDQLVTRGQMAAFINRALSLEPPTTDHFIDDNGSPFELDINSIAEAGITTGCDAQGTLFCPDALVTRGELATFIRRSQDLGDPLGDYFTDDAGSFHEDDINSIAEVGITRGCDAAGSRYCPLAAVTRGAMAAFFNRSLGLPSPLLRVPMSDHSGLSCSPAGDVCSMTVDVKAGRGYKIEEGIFQVLPASEQELAKFNSSVTEFNLTVDGARVALIEKETAEEGGLAFRRWEYPLSFTPGNHTLIGRWTWDGTQIRSTTLTVRVSG